MKILFCLFLILTSGAVFCAGNNFLKNPNFNLDKDIITGWNKLGNPKIITDNNISGNCVYMSSDNNSTTMGIDQFVITDDWSFPSNYRYSALFKCGKDIDENGDLWLYSDIYYKDGTHTWGPYSIVDRSNHDWQKITLDIITGKPVEKLYFLIIFRNAKGSVTITNPSIEIIEDIETCVTFSAEKLSDNRVIVSGAYDFISKYDIKIFGKDSNYVDFSGTGKNLKFELPAGFCEDEIKLDIKTNENKTKTITIKNIKNEDLKWWVESSFKRIFLDTLKPEYPTTSIDLFCAKNEFESAQIALRAVNKDLNDLKIQFSDLKSGKNIISKNNLTYNPVGFIYVTSNRYGVFQDGEHKISLYVPYLEKTESDWWGDILLETKDINIKSGDTLPIWITAYIPKDTASGEYTGTINVFGADEKIEIPIKINVYNFTIPDKGTIKTAFATMDGFLKKFYKENIDKARENHIDYLYNHRLNFDDITRADFPKVEDLKKVDDKLNYFTLINVAEKAKPEDDWVCFMELEAYNDEFISRFTEKLDKIYPELVKAGLADKAYVYGFDERQAEYRPVIKKIFGIIKERYPQLKTITTAMFYDRVNPMDYNVDAFVPIIGQYAQKQHDDFVNAGGEMWWYVCGDQSFAIECPLVEGRLIFWQTYLNDIDGFLYWGTNVWDRDNNNRTIGNDEGYKIDWDVSTGSCSGDGRMLYPGNNETPLGSPRIEAIRDGLEETEIMFAYEEVFGKENVKEMLRPVIQGKFNFSRDGNFFGKLEMLYNIKKEMLEKLNEL